MYIVRLNPNLVEANARIRTSSGLPRTGMANTVTDVGGTTELISAALSGTLHNGCNATTAQIAPGSSGTITVTFQFRVPSVTAATFDTYRTGLKEVVGDATEAEIAQAAGIRAKPPPEPSSRMARYALEVFTEVVFGGHVVADQSSAFSDQDCTVGVCQRMLDVTRSLEVTEALFSGTLTATSDSPTTTKAAAYVPITAVEFSDGLTIPFAGYSTNVAVDYGGLRLLQVPAGFWTELASGEG
jgi:hypothetical protein